MSKHLNTILYDDTSNLINEVSLKNKIDKNDILLTVPELCINCFRRLDDHEIETCDDCLDEEFEQDLNYPDFDDEDDKHFSWFEMSYNIPQKTDWFFYKEQQ